jgi:hypothetical protein
MNKGRTLHVDDEAYPLSPAQVAALTGRQLIYGCGAEHDMHLMPDGPRDAGWTLDDIALLVKTLLGPSSRSGNVGEP